MELETARNNQIFVFYKFPKQTFENQKGKPEGSRTRSLLFYGNGFKRHRRSILCEKDS